MSTKTSKSNWIREEVKDWYALDPRDGFSWRVLQVAHFIHPLWLASIIGLERPTITGPSEVVSDE